jgi:acetoin utilization deacetylase AcuC-like enzyme
VNAPEAAIAIAIVDDERFDAHRERSGTHPERPERLFAARAGVTHALPKERRIDLAPHRATDAELTRVHPSEYVGALSRALARGSGQLDPDTYFAPGSAEAAWFAAGGAATMARALMRGDARRGLALVRPPGHHAVPDRPMGFCLLNNVAIAATAALEAGARKVAIVDWDVHHGNGTQDVFYDDPRVLFVSLHQYPFYPGTGAPAETGTCKGTGTTANLALPAGSGPETYADAFRRVVVPLLDRFGADLVLVSAGFDAHARDPLAQMHLDEASYQAFATALVDHVEARGHGRLGCVLEGGYDLQALEGSVAATVRAMLGQRLALPEGAAPPTGRASVDATLRALAPFWQLDRAS